MEKNKSYFCSEENWSTVYIRQSYDGDNLISLINEAKLSSFRKVDIPKLTFIWNMNFMNRPVQHKKVWRLDHRSRQCLLAEFHPQMNQRQDEAQRKLPL